MSSMDVIGRVAYFALGAVVTAVLFVFGVF